MADPGIAGKTTLVCKGVAGISGSRTLLGSTARSRPHSVRGSRNHRVPAFAEERKGPGTSGDRGERPGQPKGRFVGELRGDLAFRHWISGGGRAGNRPGSYQSKRER